MYSVSIKDWTFAIEDGSLPDLYADYVEHARFADHFDTEDSDGHPFFLAINNEKKQTGWPFAIVTLRHPGKWAPPPGILLAPETSRLFVGAGERLICYDLNKEVRLWEDTADCGFWRWGQHEDFVLMSAELEFTVFTTKGEKLWSTFVEPPWSYHIVDQTIVLDVMGNIRRHDLSTGKSA